MGKMEKGSGSLGKEKEHMNAEYEEYSAIFFREATFCFSPRIFYRLQTINYSTVLLTTAK